MKKVIVVLLLLCLAGCGTSTEAPTETPTEVPTEAPTPLPTKTPVETETPSPIYTDWSKLTPYEPVQQIYSYHAGYCGAGGLAARDDYGPLLPYIGRYSSMEPYVIDALPLFGLVTSRGEIVTDSVYTNISCYDGFLVLDRAEEGGTYDYSLTLVAPDGRWVHTLNDSVYISGGDSLLLTGAGDGSLDLWNTDGETVMHFDGSLFAPWFGENCGWGGEEGPFVNWTDERVGYVIGHFANGEYVEQGIRLYLDFVSGAVTDTPLEGYPAEIDYASIPHDAPEPPVIEGYNYLDPVCDTVTGETYFLGYDYSGGSVHHTLFDREGRMLLENISMARFEQLVIVRAGLYSTVENGCFCYRSLADNAVVFRYAMWTNSD